MVGFKGKIEIKIGGKKRTLKFGTNQTAIITELYNIPLKKFSEEFNEDNMGLSKTRDFIYAALASGELTEGKADSLSEVSFTRWEVGDWLDDLSKDDIEKIFKAMSGNSEDNPKKKKKAKD